MAAMNSARNLDHYIRGFLKDLQKKRTKEIRALRNIENGFEAWIKIQFFAYCLETLRIPASEIGMEYKAKLKKSRKYSIGEKQIDIRVTNNKRKYHYIELKVAFQKWNPGKQLQSWVNDFEALSGIKQRQPENVKADADEVASVVFGIGYKNDEWQNETKKYAGARIKMLKALNFTKDIHVAMLLKKM